MLQKLTRIELEMILDIDGDLIMAVGSPTRDYKSRSKGMEIDTSKQREIKANQISQRAEIQRREEFEPEIEQCELFQARQCTFPEGSAHLQVGVRMP